MDGFVGSARPLLNLRRCYKMRDATACHKCVVLFIDFFLSQEKLFIDFFK